jgi:prephenate dehydrogenase
MGAVTHATLDLRQAVAGAELIVLCTPLAQMGPLVEKMRPWLEPGTIVTDVGSVKKSVVRTIAPLVARAGAHFIGSHPMAGSEKTGVEAARPDLFVNAACVVTAIPQSNRPALRRVTEFWKSVGSRVIRLTPQAHDEIVSRSSHLPHVLAAQLSNLVLNPKRTRLLAMLCANGFRDTTRIASGSPEMWRDIALANRQNLIDALNDFGRGLRHFQLLLKKNDSREISRFFLAAKERRDRWCRSSASSSPE